MIWHVQQNVVKCFITPLPRFSYIYWLIHFKVEPPNAGHLQIADRKQTTGMTYYGIFLKKPSGSGQ